MFDFFRMKNYIISYFAVAVVNALFGLFNFNFNLDCENKFIL